MPCFLPRFGLIQFHFQYHTRIEVPIPAAARSQSSHLARLCRDVLGPSPEIPSTLVCSPGERQQVGLVGLSRRPHGPTLQWKRESLCNPVL